jgi:hypothetical protein
MVSPQSPHKFILVRSTESFLLKSGSASERKLLDTKDGKNSTNRNSVRSMKILDYSHNTGDHKFKPEINKKSEELAKALKLN